jgi:gamma-glutamyltranspeptidase/glutathione hydrolase
VVSSADARASEEAARVLAEGGNAVDAAITCALVLGVVEQQSAGIGGGGFLLSFEARTGRVHALDYRERAPRRAHRDMFLRHGAAVPRLSLDGHLSVAVPGTIAGLYEAHRKLGRLAWERLVKPAARIAERGYAVGRRVVRALRKRQRVLRRFPASTREFFPGGRVPQAGALLRHPDLAATLRAVSRGGAAAFYEGAVAERIALEMRRGGGILDGEDLRRYRPLWREPLRGRYRGLEVVSVPPPSSGGVLLLQILNILAEDDLSALDPGTRAHLLVEAMRRAFADRAAYLGDPAFAQVPVRGLTDRRYGRALRAGIDLARRTPSRRVQAGAPGRYESPNTTHLSVVDGEGNVVALTQSVNWTFGSGVVVPGTGILLNDTMDDFSVGPGSPNAFQLVGGEANAVAAGKAPLSSMTPTLVLRDGRPWLALGANGGSMIITGVLQVLLGRVALGRDLASAVSAPRLHHQWLPDEVLTERDRPLGKAAALLRRLGHRLRGAISTWLVNSVELAPDGSRLGVADPRGEGATAGF